MSWHTSAPSALIQRYKRHLTVHSSEKPFKCPECPFRSKWKVSVKGHLKVVHILRPPDARPFPCPHPGCNYAAKQKSYLISHSKVHSDEKPLVCSHPDCNYSTNQKQYLTLHTRIHTGEKPFVCQFESCSYAASNRSSLLLHTRTHTKEKPYKCTELNCEYSTGVSFRLKLHQLTHAPKEGEERPLFSCSICEYKGKTKAHLSAHVKSHTLEKLFKCDEPNCNYEAKRKGHIKNHKLVHSDEKPFVCSVDTCTYRSKYKNSFSSHLKTHSEERPFKCELCPFRGKTRGTVVAHLRDRHIQAQDRAFKCAENSCDAAFSTKQGLQRHLSTHSTQKPYACTFPSCSYRGTGKRNVNEHENRVHDSEKRQKCLLCDFRYKTKSNLTTHMRTHTKEEPYKCPEENCKYSARSSDSLRHHKKILHPHIVEGGK